MSHVNIGILLDEFNINIPEDFFRLNVSDRYTFLSRVKSSAEHLTEDVLTELRGTSGLKMHFRVNRHPELGWQNIPNEIFAKKIAFFASKSVITFPFEEVAHWKRDDLHSLLTLLCITRPFLKEGLVSILPANQKSGPKTSELLSDKYGLVSANFHLDKLEDQFEEKCCKAHVANLYIPYFNGIKPEDVIRLRHEEKLLYDGFEHRLSKLLSTHSDLSNEEKLLEELYEVDQHVRQLTTKFEAIQEAYRRKNIYMLIGFATVGLVMFFPPGIVPALAPVLGTSGITMLAYLQSKLDHANNKKGLKEDEFYLLWRLHNMSANQVIKGLNSHIT